VATKALPQVAKQPLENGQFLQRLTNNAEWRTKVREELFEGPDKTDEDTNAAVDEADDFDPPLPEPEFQSVKEALAAADDLVTFAEFYGNEELAQATSNALISSHSGGLAPEKPGAFEPRHLKIPPTQAQVSSTKSYHSPSPGSKI